MAVPATSRYTRASRTALWSLRAVWVAVAVIGTPALAEGLDDHSSSVQQVAAAGAWIGWAAALLGLLVPVTATLTLVRLLVPVALPVAVASAIAGDLTVWDALLLGLAVAALVLVLSGDLGDRFVQGSAYGDERRLLLRPPVAWLAPVTLAWMVVAAAALTGPLLLAADQWIVGAVVTLAAVALVVFLLPRFHRLARRWLVLVPAGLVVHDDVTLHDTLMVRRRDVTGVGLAPDGATALDLTGVTWGVGIELALRAPVPLVLAGTPQQPRGEPLTTDAVVVAPSRPGAALQAARERGYDVTTAPAGPPPSTRRSSRS